MILNLEEKDWKENWLYAKQVGNKLEGFIKWFRRGLQNKDILESSVNFIAT